MNSAPENFSRPAFCTPLANAYYGPAVLISKAMANFVTETLVMNALLGTGLELLTVLL